MKLSVECEVDSKTKINKEIEIVHRTRKYVFYPNEQGFLARLKIIAEVEQPEKFYSVITLNPSEGVKAHFNVKTDLELWKSIINEFQEFESLLGLTYSLKRIQWDTPKRELLFDSEEEKEKAEIYNFKTWFEYRDPPTETSEADLKNIVENKSDFTPLIGAMSFFREGINDKNRFKYINAFFNFYFILEGIYGKGKTKNNQIEREFKNSEEFKVFIAKALQNSQQYKPENYRQLVKMLNDLNKQVDVNSVIELIIKTRGQLHHFTNNPKRPQGTPFFHQEYVAIALLTMEVALHAILSKMEEINGDYLSRIKTE
jgi:hypothetical protein